MAFSDPIVAGEELIRTGIRSPDYAAGLTGWRIARDGSAEFNNVKVRGNLTLPAAPVISTPGTAPGSNVAWERAGAVVASIRTIADGSPLTQLQITVAGPNFDGSRPVVMSRQTPIVAILGNSWAALPPYEAPQYWMDAEGVVHVVGVGQSGARSTVAFTLPAGYRPAATHRCNDSAGPAAPGAIDVFSNGQVIPLAGGVAGFFAIDTEFVAAP